MNCSTGARCYNAALIPLLQCGHGAGGRRWGKPNTVVHRLPYAGQEPKCPIRARLYLRSGISGFGDGHARPKAILEHIPLAEALAGSAWAKMQWEVGWSTWRHACNPYQRADEREGNSKWVRSNVRQDHRLKEPIARHLRQDVDEEHARD